MEGEITINVKFENNREAENFLTSIKTELTETKRIKVKANIKNNNLILKIYGKDITALRAASNTFLRYLQLIEKIR